MSVNDIQALEIQAKTPPNNFGVHMRALMNAWVKGTEELTAAHGITHMEYSVLRVFLDQEEWTAKQLTVELGATAARISLMVAKLVDMRLLWRRRPRNDRRTVILAMTEEGNKLTIKLDRLVQSYQATLFRDVREEEMEVFLSVVRKMMVSHATLLRSHPSTRET